MVTRRERHAVAVAVAAAAAAAAAVAAADGADGGGKCNCLGGHLADAGRAVCHRRGARGDCVGLCGVDRAGGPARGEGG